ncbi:GNAT family N-acetyltransferase [Plantactinospora sp. WMMB782]|uniref:GNAT family N-acetyltransferase n=1 Tax=Plantactinospora sp. WMMB782 TaxID=3404121 RepID=UPI003B93E236
MLTATNLHTRIAAELDQWGRGEYEFDVTIDGCELRIADDGLACHVEHIAVPGSAEGRGYGSAMLSAVTAWADREQVTVRLHASEEFGTDRAALARFYARHGFVPANRIGGMVRHPHGQEN